MKNEDLTVKRLSEPIDYMYPNATLTIITEHNIDCPNCYLGVTKGFFGIHRICQVCKGTNSIGTYTTKRTMI